MTLLSAEPKSGLQVPPRRLGEWQTADLNALEAWLAQKAKLNLCQTKRVERWTVVW